MTRETDSLERRIIPGNKSGGGCVNGPCCDLYIDRSVYAFLSTSDHRCPKRIGNETNYSVFLTPYTWWWLCPHYRRASGVGVEVAKWREGMFHDERPFQKVWLGSWAALFCGRFPP